MFVHVHVESFNEYASGAVIRPVHCERCQAEYFYELARIAKGTGSAVYGLGKEAARKRARRAAEKKLNRLLHNDTEAVACPNCRWIQMAMVLQLRARCHVWMKYLAWLCTGLAILIVSTYGLFTLIDPHIAATILSWMAMPTLILALLGVGMSGVRTLRANAFDPNSVGAADGRPAVCGAPPPLVHDDARQFIVAKPELCEGDSGNSVIVQIARALNCVPRNCCSCLGPAQKSSKPAFCDTGLLTIPLCKSCLSSWNWRSARAVLAAVAASALISCITAMSFPDVKQPERIAIAIGGGVVLSIVAGVAVFRSIPHPFRGRWIDKRRGVVKLTFANQQFAKTFVDRYRSRVPNGQGNVSFASDQEVIRRRAPSFQMPPSNAQHPR